MSDGKKDVLWFMEKTDEKSYIYISRCLYIPDALWPLSCLLHSIQLF